jgi:hypothetical protein
MLSGPAWLKFQSIALTNFELNKSVFILVTGCRRHVPWKTRCCLSTGSLLGYLTRHIRLVIRINYVLLYLGITRQHQRVRSWDAINHITCDSGSSRNHTNYTGSRAGNDVLYAGPHEPQFTGKVQLQCYVAGGDIWNRKTSFNPSPEKAELQCRSNFENLWAVYLWRRTGWA